MRDAANGPHPSLVYLGAQGLALFTPCHINFLLRHPDESQDRFGTSSRRSAKWMLIFISMTDFQQDGRLILKANPV
jgi:hypothetical protein